jgi:hypothetical protein
MAMYEMKVKTYLEDDRILEWSGSELFEADSKEDALRDAVMSEYQQVLDIPEHTEIFNIMCEEVGVGGVYWTNGSGQRLYEEITVERFEY